MPALFAVENFYSITQFPLHVIAAEEAADGHEAWRVATGRRSGLSYWTPTTANSDTWIKATYDRLRSCDYVALDRGHNLAGYDLAVQVSSDDFATYDEIGFTIPSATATGSIDDANGVLTEEGAWLARYDALSGMAARLFIPAMGSGLLPVITGLYVGLSLELAWPPIDAIFADDQDEAVATEVASDVGWTGDGGITQRRIGQYTVRLMSHVAYDQVRYHLQKLYGSGAPLWFVPDTDQADRALLVRRPPGELGFSFANAFPYRQGTLAYREHEPALP